MKRGSERGGEGEERWEGMNHTEDSDANAMLLGSLGTPRESEV